MTRDRRAILIAGLAAGVPASVIGNTDASSDSMRRREPRQHATSATSCMPSRRPC